MKVNPSALKHGLAEEDILYAASLRCSLANPTKTPPPNSSLLASTPTGASLSSRC